MPGWVGCGQKADVSNGPGRRFVVSPVGRRHRFLPGRVVVFGFVFIGGGFGFVLGRAFGVGGGFSVAFRSRFRIGLGCRPGGGIRFGVRFGVSLLFGFG